MYLTQRLVGVSVFIITLLIICFLIYKCKSYRNIKLILIVYIIFLSLMSYFFKPVTSVDLVRLQNQLTTFFSKMSFSTMLFNLKHDLITNYTTYSYFFLISKMNNPNLLQTFTSINFYSIIFYIVYDYAKKNELSSLTISNVVFYIMINGQFVELISGIRTMLGFSFILLALYREFYNNKSFLSNILIYIIAIGCHNAILPIFLIRLLYLGLQKEKNILFRIFNLLLLFVLLFIFFKYGNAIIESSVNRANLYLNNQIYIQKWEYIASFFRIILMYYLVFISNKFNRKNIKIKNYLNLGFYYLLFSTLFCNEYTMLHRYSIFISLFMIPVVANFIDKTLKKDFDENNYTITFYRLIYLLFLLIIAVLVFTRGNMTELTFF